MYVIAVGTKLFEKAAAPANTNASLKRTYMHDSLGTRDHATTENQELLCLLPTKNRIVPK